MATSAERQRRHRKSKRDHGLCGWGGCRALSGADYYCPEHAQARPKTIAVSGETRDRLNAAAKRRHVSLAVLTEALLERSLKEMERAA